MTGGRARSRVVALLALAALAGLTGCPKGSGPERYSTTGSAAAQVTPSPTTTGATTSPGYSQTAQASTSLAGSGDYVVAGGDTLYGISRRSGVPLRTIIDANGLQPPYALQTGQRLIIPQVQTYTVQGGDTVYGISRRFGVEVTELARQNNIAPPYTIAPGQVLVLPHGASGAGQVAATPTTIPSAPVTTSSSAPVTTSPTPTTTSSGGITATPLPPQGGQPIPTQPQPAALPGQPQPTGPQPITPPVAQPTPVPAPAPAAVPAGGSAGPAVLPEPPARAGSKFIWPVNGTVISGYGPKAGGLHNDGINIGAPKGSPVQAAENGVVAYVGSDLKSFGNLVLIKHQGDFVTAYAHNDQVLVKRGDIVRRGQTIARVGSTGGVDTPQLHFEIRKGSKAVEPTAQMTTQTAAN